MTNAILMAGYTHREGEFPLDRNAFDAMLKNLQEGVTSEPLKIRWRASDFRHLAS